MRRSLPAFALVLSCLLAASIARATSSAADYSLTVTTSAEGIRAACEAGCAWTTLAAQNPAGTYRLTDRGVFPVIAGAGGARPIGLGAFSFVLTTDGAGIEATCERGCRWDRLSAASPGGTYRLDQSGVQTLAR